MSHAKERFSFTKYLIRSGALALCQGLTENNLQDTFAETKSSKHPHNHTDDLILFLSKAHMFL